MESLPTEDVADRAEIREPWPGWRAWMPTPAAILCAAKAAAQRPPSRTPIGAGSITARSSPAATACDGDVQQGQDNAPSKTLSSASAYRGLLHRLQP